MSYFIYNAGWWAEPLILYIIHVGPMQLCCIYTMWQSLGKQVISDIILGMPSQFSILSQYFKQK